MPFKLGPHPIRRSLKYLEAGSLVFKDYVKVMTINYNVDEFAHKMAATHPGQVPFYKDREWYTKSAPHHRGALDFVFWNLEQIQYKNPNVQIVELRNMTPSPYITCFLENGEPVYFDVDSQTNTEILDRLTKTLGETQETLEARARAAEKKDNPANFGKNCDRYCICSIPGQLPCPSLVPLPKFWRGKYHFGQAMDEEED